MTCLNVCEWAYPVVEGHIINVDFSDRTLVRSLPKRQQSAWIKVEFLRLFHTWLLICMHSLRDVNPLSSFVVMLTQARTCIEPCILPEIMLGDE